MNLYSLYVTDTECFTLPNDGCRILGDYCFLIVPGEGVGVVMHDGSVVVMRAKIRGKTSGLVEISYRIWKRYNNTIMVLQ